MAENTQKKAWRNKPAQVAAVAVDENHPVLRAFQSYARELDDKHDRHERIVKLSRDVTIESKRIIFLLHTIDGRKNNKVKVLEEAEQRLNKLIDTKFKFLAKELVGQDPYQYRWAYSPGLQEFVEAFYFAAYVRSCDLDQDDENASMGNWLSLQQQMQYEKSANDNQPPTSDVEKGDEQPPPEQSMQKFEFFLDPTEWILGLSDLTGELMRRCINSLGSGETAICLDTCRILQQFYTGYVSLNVVRCRELSRKIFTMRQSVLKAEYVCYNVKVRGCEAASHGTVFENKHAEDIDEGFF